VDGYRLPNAREKLLALGDHVSPTETLHVVKDDPDDDRILECAATAKSDFIVSEDEDSLRLGKFGNARIVSVRTVSIPSPQFCLSSQTPRVLTREMPIDRHRRARVEGRLYFIPVKVLTGELASASFRYR
jgi:hypothetical protein